MPLIRITDLTGFALHVCVESTLCDGRDLGYDVIVLDDATAAFTGAQREYVLNHVVHHYGAHMTVAEFTNEIN